MIPPRSNPISWDECFMRMAAIIALRSKDPSTQVGAVITTQNNIVVGMGYNGFPRNVAADAFPWDREGAFLDTKYPYTVHAEANAIYNAHASTEGCKIYVKLFPCNECAKSIIQKGITEVIYEDDKYANTDAVVASKRLFNTAGVVFRQYSSEWYVQK